MQQQLSMMITAQQWWLGYWLAGQLYAMKAFAMTEAGTLALQQAILQTPNTPLYTVCNLPDELYHTDTLPPVRGRTRQQLLARKMVQCAPHSAYHRVYPLGQQPAAGSPHPYLFCALSPPVLVQNWLDWCEQQGLRVAVMTMQSLLMPAWVRMLLPHTPHVLLLVPIGQEVRVTYHQHGQLFFSRLLSIEGLGATPEMTTTIPLLATEIAHTVQYLQSKQWLREAEALSILYCVATTGPATDALYASLSAALDQVRLAQAKLVMLPVLQVLPQLPWSDIAKQRASAAPAPYADGIDYLSTADPMRDAVLATLMASSKRTALTAEGLYLHASVLQAKRWLRGVGLGVCGVACLSAWLLMTIWHPNSLRQLLPTANLTEVANVLPANANAQAIMQFKQLLAIDQVLINAQRHPASVLQHFQRVLTSKQGWQLQQLHWAWGPAPAHRVTTAATPLLLIPRGYETPSPGVSAHASNPPIPAPDSDWQVFVRMRLQPQPGVHPQQAMADWQVLLRELQQAAWVDHLEVMHAGSAQEGIQGDTRQPDVLPTQADLLIWLK